MKSIILAVTLFLSSLLSQGQGSKVYKINRSELYIMNKETGEWEQQSIHDDVSIDFVTYKSVINIQAKTPSLYRLDEESKEKIETTSLIGYKYKAFECVDMKNCVVEVLVSKNQETKIFIFSVFFNNEVLGKVNFRFLGYVE